MVEQNDKSEDNREEKIKKMENSNNPKKSHEPKSWFSDVYKSSA